MREIAHEIAHEIARGRNRTGAGRAAMSEAFILASMIATGVPIVVSILGSAPIGVWLLNGSLGFLNAALSLYDGATSFPLIAIPLFALAAR